ncbi:MULTISPECIES: zinc-binding dehydrogenase [Gordonia]|uniref:alcohol dehydrogenase n=1 Tax=Gordonia amicalis TaxID=89053 RepID=A0AAE4R2H5_9ACTN|nr:MULTISPECIES: zinc-binding dehydrogenase [Gordonia]ATD69286.1 dehydrogenase [Gordonia sp. 1D]KAF0968827.1 D-arabitol-phosphate dehydrogenase [Gordonia sp. YY1]MCR8899061.1 zinc-binding dehydrogenase [Gordonia sp. GONU]MCZ0911266.1 zinc-binding dehydrogenase [Gordonia amicalis]MCZ4579394.1 zinc-binding dehydrogenase [Gordonia amicalis]
MDTFETGLTRAAVWRGDRIDIVEMPLPAPGRGEIVVRIRLATVCGSDLHTVSGRRQSPCPSVLGHEAVGEVVAVGAGAPARVGDRVVWSVTVACGECDRCGRGITAKCRRVRKVGHESFDSDWTLSGGYATHIVLPSGTAVVRVPEHLGDAVAAPAACATATVMAAVERAGDMSGRRVLIGGAGMLGTTAAAVCTDRGAHAMIVDPDRVRLGQAVSFGALLDDGEMVDAVLDFTGAASFIRESLPRLAISGALVLAGSVAPGPLLEVDPEQIVRRWWTITGIHNYEPRHLREAVAFLGRTVDRHPWSELVTDPLPLEQIETAVRSAPGRKLRVAVAP